MVKIIQVKMGKVIKRGDSGEHITPKLLKGLQQFPYIT